MKDQDNRRALEQANSIIKWNSIYDAMSFEEQTAYLLEKNEEQLKRESEYNFHRCREASLADMQITRLVYGLSFT